MRTPPFSVNFTALPTRLVRIWRRRIASASTSAGVSGEQGRDDLDTLGVRARRQQFDNAFDDGARVDLLVLQRQRAGFDLGEVEDVFDQGEQRRAGFLDGFDISALLGNELCFQQKARHAQHAVHGRADLVAHGGEEAGFGAAGRFRAIARFGQCVFHGFAFGDVAAHALDFDETSARVAQREIFPRDPAPAVGGAHELIVARTRMSHLQAGEARNAAAVGMEFGGKGAAERLLRLKSEEPEEGVIGIGEAAVRRAPEDGITLRVDEAFVTRFAFVQPSVDRGHRLERRLETFRHSVHFGRAFLQHAGAAAGLEKSCE